MHILLLTLEQLISSCIYTIWSHIKIAKTHTNLKTIMSKESFKGLYDRTKPFMFIIFLQTSYAVGSLVIKSALNKGLNHYTFAVYRNAIATLFFGPLAFFFERYIYVSIYIHVMNCINPPFCFIVIIHLLVETGKLGQKWRFPSSWKSYYWDY